MLGFVSAHIVWNPKSNLELRRYYKALRSDLVVPSASTTIPNTRWREYSLTLDAMMKQLLSGNKVSVALDWRTSTNKLAIMSSIVYYVDRTGHSRKYNLRPMQLITDSFPFPKAN